MLFTILFSLSMDYELFLRAGYASTGPSPRQSSRRHRRTGRDSTRHHRRRRDHGVRVRVVHI